MPILVITDIMCRVGPLIHKLCPTAAPDNGVLPRVGEPDEDGMRKVDIPALAVLPGNNYSGAGEIPQPEVPQETCEQENVYNLLRDAAPKPPLQRLDFEMLLEVSASRDLSGSGGGSVPAVDFVLLPAVDFVLLARGCLRQLHRHSRHSMDLFEVVAILNARITQVVARIDGGEEMDIGSVRQTLADQGEFSTRVLAVATGSTTGKAPALPSFSEALFGDLLAEEFFDVGCSSLENLCFKYADVSPFTRIHLSLCVRFCFLLRPADVNL